MLGNLRSISIRTMQETQKSKLGLVVEGGGVRAIYAAGVLDVLHDMRLPFSGVIGVSAGAIHGISFVSGQKGRSYRIYTRFCRDPRFFSFRTWLRTGNIVDNDFCYRQIPQELEPFDQKAFEASGMEFWTVSTNLETGKPEYIRMRDCFAEIDALIASASLPYVSKPVHYRGKLLLDGGCSDRVPLRAFSPGVLIKTSLCSRTRKIIVSRIAMLRSYVSSTASTLRSAERLKIARRTTKRLRPISKQKSRKAPFSLLDRRLRFR